jgi:hypothetical protein
MSNNPTVDGRLRVVAPCALSRRGAAVEIAGFHLAVEEPKSRRQRRGVRAGSAVLVVAPKLGLKEVR